MIGNQLKNYRESKGLTAKQMSQLLEISPSTYHGWENGAQITTPHHYIEIARCLGISVHELICGERNCKDKIVADIFYIEELVKKLKENVIAWHDNAVANCVCKKNEKG